MSKFDNPTDPESGWQRDHLHQYVATNGADGHFWNGVPTLLLTTVGRKSGQARRTPLIYGQDGDRYLIVASKGGTDAPPEWYLNLQSDPQVRLQVGAEIFDATAGTASPEDKARLWPTMTAIWPDYDEYQKKTEREIPIVILTRS